MFSSEYNTYNFENISNQHNTEELAEYISDTAKMAQAAYFKLFLML